MKVREELYVLAALLQRKETPVPITLDDGWFSQSVWKLWRKEKSLDPAWNQIPIPR
jgi:hypothetical protein